MPDVWPEGQVYKVLKEHGVHNIPDCISSGDIVTDQFYISTKLQRHVLISKNFGCVIRNRICIISFLIDTIISAWMLSDAP